MCSYDWYNKKFNTQLLVRRKKDIGMVKKKKSGGGIEAHRFPRKTQSKLDVAY